jgi:coenzyme F420-reducing hydrogenase delta subunit
MADVVDLGCDDGQLETGECATARRTSYQRNVEHLRVRCTGLVERLEFLEQGERAAKQRQLNMRLNGIH